MSTLQLQDGELDLRTREVRRNGAVERLTGRECALVAYLVENEHRVVSLDELHRDVWHTHPSVVTRAAYHTAVRVRRKIEIDPSKPVHLVTTYGDGLQWRTWGGKERNPLVEAAFASWDRFSPPSEEYEPFLNAADRAFQEGDLATASACAHAAFRKSPFDQRTLALLDRMLAAEIAPEYRWRLELDRSSTVNDRHQRARALQKALISAEAYGDPSAKLSCLIQRATLLRENGELEAAEADVAEGFRLLERVVHSPNESLLWKAHGGILRSRGKLLEAEAAYQRSLALEQALGGEGDWSAAYTLSDLGIVYAYQGRMDRALFYFRWSVELHERAHNHRYAVIVRQNLAICLLNQGSVEEAIGLLEALLLEYTNAGTEQLDHFGIIKVKLAQGYLLLGQLDRARAIAEEAVVAVSGSRNGPHLVEALALSAVIWAQLGQETEALHQLAAAREVLGDPGHRQVRALLYFRMAQVERAFGREASAFGWFRESGAYGGATAVGAEWGPLEAAMKLRVANAPG